MRIALVVHDFDPRFGQGNYCVELCRRLRDRHRIDVFSNTFVEPSEPGVEWVRVPAWRRRALTTVFTFLLGSERRLRGRAYDVIHAQGLTCWRADVITAHICTAARLAQAGTIGGKDARFARIILPWERRFYRRRGARLIGVSRLVETEIQTRYGWNGPSSVIYHGIDTDRFRPAGDDAEQGATRRELGLPAEGWCWLFVGEAVKGLGEVIEQLPAFPQARLMAVSRSDFAPYRNRAAQLGVGPRVHFIGPRNDLDRVYRVADVFVYPSRYDTFGMVVAEAMASGLPVVVGRGIGAAEWIHDRQNGLLCDPDDPAGLRALLHEIEAGKAWAASLGAGGRRTAERHDWSACAAATEEVYQRVHRRDR